MGGAGEAVFVIEVEQDFVVLNGGNVGEVYAGEGIIAFGAFLFSAGSGDNFSVKDDIDAMGFWAGGKTETVQQVGFGIGDFHVNRFLGAGDDDWLGGVLDQVGQGGCGVGHGIGAVADDEAVETAVLFMDYLGNGEPVAGLHIGAVDVEYLDGFYFAEAAGIRDELDKLLAGEQGGESGFAAFAGDGAAGGEHKDILFFHGNCPFVFIYVF